jgi:tetratricopeptide (TPR) repeat protein
MTDLRLYEAAFSRGLSLAQAGRLEAGAKALEEAIALRPEMAMAHAVLGAVLSDLGRRAEALAAYDRAIALNPSDALTLNNRAQVLLAVGRTEEAAASYREAMRLDPLDGHVRVNLALTLLALGVALTEGGRGEAAIACLDEAVSLDPRRASLHYNRGILLARAGRPAEALAAFDASLALAPEDANAHANREAALVKLVRLDEAQASYEAALRLYARAHGSSSPVIDYRPDRDIDPDYASGLWTSSFVHLLQGRLDTGWRRYEWRRSKWGDWAPRFDPAREWSGAESLAGKVIHLYCEQGLGDTIQFCRYVFPLKAQGATVVLSVQASLKALLQQLEPAATVIGVEDAPPAFDYHRPLMSLPLALGTTVQSIPGPDRYLTADPERRARFEALLGPRSRPRIGIAWSGNPQHENDRNRSIALARLAPILTREADWFALQTEVREADAAALANAPLTFHGDRLKDLADTAALVDLMDLVVTVDTSLARLAGAMGKPVWILLPFSPDWRWMTQRPDSPWYPTARLFRQPGPGDWESVTRAVRTALQAIR